MDDSIKQQKALIRREMLTRRDALDPEERATKSLAIKNTLFTLPEIISASTILFYVSFRSEVQTEAMIQKALGDGKMVAVPKTSMNDKRLILYRLKNFKEDLSPGTWGILEPKSEKLKPVAYEDIGIVVTPGAAFCEEGWRIGYGGGFYDKLLRESGKRACALAFEMQILENIPHIHGHDIPVNYIITEKRIINCDRLR